MNNDVDRASVRRLVKEENIAWRSWWDGGDTGNPIARAWSVRAWPTVYLVDKGGVVRFQDLDGEALDLATDILLNEATHGGEQQRAKPDDRRS